MKIVGLIRAALPRVLVLSCVVAASTTRTPAGSGSETGLKGRTPDLGNCGNLKPPQGSRLLFRAYAEGVQIYQWTGSAWRFVAPEAVLYAQVGVKRPRVVGIHYAGPTWEMVNGSRVVGSVLDRCTPRPKAIPWLLLGVVESEGAGDVARATHIQRLDTRDGLAPSVPGRFVGQTVRVPYTAEYDFHQAGL